MITIRQLDDRTYVSGQVAAHEVAGLAEQGITVLVNNRPDGEDAGQPAASEIEEAATAAGIKYLHVPIRFGIGPSEIETMAQAHQEAEGGKLLAFCRSGTRSALALGVVKRHSGESADEVQRCLSEAGFDPGPIAHLL